MWLQEWSIRIQVGLSSLETVRQFPSLYLHVYLVAQLKIFLTALETPTYPENTVNKNPYIFLPLLVLSRASQNTKNQFAEGQLAEIPFTKWLILSLHSIVSLLVSGTVVGTGDKAVNQRDKNVCLDGANILNTMELCQTLLSSSGWRMRGGEGIYVVRWNGPLDQVVMS